jgi:site-specific DNA recombinase
MATLATTRRNGNGSRLAVPSAPAVSCAIYTRKSTDENLDNDFNSLDAQRESAEAYITSFRSEGWLALPDRYDDGGFSGGTMDRPALRRLLADVSSGHVNCVVVYKIDRLSRSLLDFAKIIDHLERHGVALVAVTQRLDTSTSIGRLTLNMLLSFAQFERELVSERTRDKVRAAKRRGKWCGGCPVYGYDIVDKKLIVNAVEAHRAGEAFRIYLETGSLIATAREMNDRGWTTKETMSKSGPRGAKPWNKGVLHGLLTNPTLIGRVVTGGQSYPGEHEAIVDLATWEAVQAQLESNGGDHTRAERHRSNALLAGILKCSCGASMTYTFCSKGARRYSFYACSRRIKGGKAACSAPYLSAPKIEAQIVAQIASMAGDPRLVEAVCAAATEQLAERRKAVADDLRAVSRAIRDAEKERNCLDDSAAVARMDGRVGEYQARRDALQAERVALNSTVVNEDEVATLLSTDFSTVWQQLTSREKRRVFEILAGTQKGISSPSSGVGSAG